MVIAIAEALDCVPEVLEILERMGYRYEGDSSRALERRDRAWAEKEGDSESLDRIGRASAGNVSPSSPEARALLLRLRQSAERKHGKKRAAEIWESEIESKTR